MEKENARAQTEYTIMMSTMILQILILTLISKDLFLVPPNNIHIQEGVVLVENTLIQVTFPHFTTFFFSVNIDLGDSTYKAYL